MQEIGAYEAKAHLSKLLDAVAAGECIKITKRGVPVALLTPIEKPQDNAQSTIAKLRQWRKGITWDEGMSTREAIEKGRR